MEPDFERIDELFKVGLAKVGGRGDIQFGNEWSTRRVDEWLRELLPAAFKTVCEPVQDEELEYSWRLLKSNRSHLSFHRELPDGVDLISAKGGKSKGWQDSKLYFGMFLIISYLIYYSYVVQLLVCLSQMLCVKKRRRRRSALPVSITSSSESCQLSIPFIR